MFTINIHQSLYSEINASFQSYSRSIIEENVVYAINWNLYKKLIIGCIHIHQIYKLYSTWWYDQKEQNLSDAHYWRFVCQDIYRRVSMWSSTLYLYKINIIDSL